VVHRGVAESVHEEEIDGVFVDAGWRRTDGGTRSTESFPSFVLGATRVLLWAEHLAVSEAKQKERDDR
jgi:hypothetical protein